MKALPRLALGYLAFVVTFMLVMYLFDGDELDWKGNLIQSSVVGAVVMAVLYFRQVRKNKNS